MKMTLLTLTGSPPKTPWAPKVLPVLIALLYIPSSAHAIDLGTAFAMAKNNDPKYQAAKS
jgi:hypothetical protein